MPMIIGGDGTISGSKITTDINGRVGIATNSPSTYLHINDSGYGVAAIGSNDTNGFHIAKDTGTHALNFYTGAVGAGTKRFGIDVSGRVTLPYQPAFSVSYSGGGYVSSEGDSNTWDAVLWNTATGNGRFNNGNHYNGATGCFTAPVSGKYLFLTQIHHHAGGGAMNSYVYHDIAFGTTGTQAAIVAAVSYHRCITYMTTDTWFEMPPQVTILNLAANDSVFVRIVNTAGATFLGASRPDHNRWSCWFLG